MSEIGVTVVIRDSRTLEDVGTCTAPAPVKPDDLIALADGDAYRVIATLRVQPGATIVPVLASRLVLAAR